MKEIEIIVRGKEKIKLKDNDSTDLVEYSKNLSQCLLKGNVVVIETSENCYVGKPSKILAFVVKENNKKETIEITNNKNEELKTEPEDDEALVGTVTDE